MIRLDDHRRKAVESAVLSGRRAGDTAKHKRTHTKHPQFSSNVFEKEISFRSKDVIDVVSQVKAHQS